MKKWLKRIALSLASILIVALVVALAIVPGLVESRMNGVTASPGPVHPGTQQLHQRLFVADLHADSLLWKRDLLERGTRGHVDVPRLIEGNVALQGFTVVTKVPYGMNIQRNHGDSDQITLAATLQLWPPRTWTSLLERALYQAQRLDAFAARSGGRLTVIRTHKDLELYLARRRDDPQITAGFLGIEGAHALEGSIENLNALYAAGFRMIGLAHFFDNEFAGSAHGVQKGGLTEMGRELVRRMEAKGMLLDLAHASPDAIRDALAMATKPVVVSHGGVKGTCNNRRNLSDDEVRGIAQTGGVIGIGYWGTAICGTDARAVARAVRYVADLVGVEHAGLGSDFDGTITAPFDTAGVSQVTSALLEAGFTADQIALIMGENVLRVLRQTLPRE